MKKIHTKKGFTLIELLVVIAIISLLSSIVMASLSSTKKRARTTESLVELRSVDNALLAYFAENGSYPTSGGNWDGYISAYGDSLGDNWIPALVQKYIPSLSREPLNSSISSQQYIYNSDGVSYKLIWHAVEDISSVQTAYPNLLDPVRPSYSYGYWGGPNGAGF